MNERIRIETALRLLKAEDSQGLSEKLETAQKEFNEAKNGIDPFLEETEATFRRINRIFKTAGKREPFALDYEDLVAHLNNEQKKIRELEALRDEARANYEKIEEEARKSLDSTYAEVKNKQDEAGQVWNQYNSQVTEAWKKYRDAEANLNNVNKDTFNKDVKTYDYLQNALDSVNSDSLLAEFAGDEMTCNSIKKEMYGARLALETVDLRRKKMAESVKVFREVGEKLDVELLYEDMNLEAKEQIDLTQEKETERNVSTIHSTEELVTELKALNPGVEIAPADGRFDPLADSKIYASVPVADLNLPDGFYYNEKNGLTNKHNSDGPYIAVDVADIKNQVKPIEETPASEIEDLEESFNFDTLNNKENEALKPSEAIPTNDAYNYKAKFPELPKEEKVPIGKRLKVTRVRAAQVPKYLLSALILGGIGNIVTSATMAGLIVVGSPIVPIVQALFVGAGVALQRLYTLKKRKDGQVDEELENNSKIRKLFNDCAVTGGIKDAFSWLKNKSKGFIESRKMKNNSVAPSKKEGIEETKSGILDVHKVSGTPSAVDFADNFSQELDSQNLSGIGR